jgi:hypothetical protein
MFRRPTDPPEYNNYYLAPPLVASALYGGDYTRLPPCTTRRVYALCTSQGGVSMYTHTCMVPVCILLGVYCNPFTQPYPCTQGTRKTGPDHSQYRAGCPQDSTSPTWPPLAWLRPWPSALASAASPASRRCPTRGPPACPPTWPRVASRWASRALSVSAPCMQPLRMDNRDVVPAARSCTPSKRLLNLSQII